jgi:hypothetical protein
MGVTPFFLENIPKWHLLALNDSLASIARMPQTKRSQRVRTYRLNKSENILQGLEKMLFIPSWRWT